MNVNEALEPSVLSIAKDGSLTIGYQAPDWVRGAEPGSQAELWTRHAIRSGLFALSSGAAEKAAGREVDAAQIVVFATFDPSPAQQQATVEGQRQFNDSRVRVEWVNTVAELASTSPTAALEIAMAAMVEPLLPAGSAAGVLWATLVGDSLQHGLAAVGADGTASPVTGTPPADLVETLRLHKEVTHAQTGTAWIALTVTIVPGSPPSVETHPRPHDRADPVGDADWRLEAQRFPNR